MKLSKNNVINLEDFRPKESKIFTGRDLARYVKIESNIDSIADKYDNVEIIIPDNIYSINPSFLEELLYSVVMKYGRKVFLEKFTFTSQGRYNIEKPLNEAIDRILRNNTALG